MDRAYTAYIEEPDNNTPVGGCGCDLDGTQLFIDAESIGTCWLTPGDPSPAGRCTGCGSLVYVEDSEGYLKCPLP